MALQNDRDEEVFDISSSLKVFSILKNGGICG